MTESLYLNFQFDEGQNLYGETTGHVRAMKKIKKSQILHRGQVYSHLFSQIMCISKVGSVLFKVNKVNILVPFPVKLFRLNMSWSNFLPEDDMNITVKFYCSFQDDENLFLEILHLLLMSRDMMTWYSIQINIIYGEDMMTL